MVWKDDAGAEGGGAAGVLDGLCAWAKPASAKIAQHEKHLDRVSFKSQ